LSSKLSLCTMYMVVLSFKSVDEILNFDHLNGKY